MALTEKVLKAKFNCTSFERLNIQFFGTRSTKSVAVPDESHALLNAT
jgi:hypothetical protein